MEYLHLNPNKMINIADLILFIVVLIALFIGSISDFKKREVPDWLSFSLIAAGLGLRFSYSVLTLNWSYIVNGLAGFLLFVGLAYAMYYAGQWGGGDSKLLMGVGAVFGLNIYNFERFFDSILLGFFINVLFVGAVFGLLFTVYLAIRYWRKFKKEFIKIAMHRKSRKAAFILTIFLILFCLSSVIHPDRLVKVAFALLGFLTLPILYIIFFIKAVEKACITKYVKPQELTEGDWIVKDIKIDGKKICAKKDLGLERPQIDCLIRYYKKGKIKRVLIKEGVPFVPSFFIAAIATLIYGNWFFWMFF